MFTYVATWVQRSIAIKESKRGRSEFGSCPSMSSDKKATREGPKNKHKRGGYMPLTVPRLEVLIELQRKYIICPLLSGKLVTG